MIDSLINQNLAETTSLHLRNSDLTSADAINIAKQLKSNHTSKLSSISFSYNAIGNAGAIALAESFPTSIQEIGMVGCKIGDHGGRAILKWAQNATQLRMICIERNNFSAELKCEFELFQKSRPTVMVVF